MARKRTASKKKPSPQQFPRIVFGSLIALLILMTAPLAIIQNPDFIKGQLLFSDRGATNGVAELLYGRDAYGDIDELSKKPLVTLINQILTEIRAIGNSPAISPSASSPVLPPTPALPPQTKLSNQASGTLLPREHDPNFEIDNAQNTQLIFFVDLEITKDGTLPDLEFVTTSQNLRIVPQSATAQPIFLADTELELEPVFRSGTVFSQSNESYTVSFADSDTEPLSDVTVGENLRITVFGSIDFTPRNQDPNVPDHYEEDPFAQIYAIDPQTGARTLVRILNCPIAVNSSGNPVCQTQL